MKLIIVKNQTEGAEKAASIFSDFIKKKPSCVLGLATGSTMIPFYNRLVNKKNDFSKVKTVNLDEYFGLNEDNKNSFHYFMKKSLFNHVNIKKNNIFFPSERKIKLPQVDLQILGIGVNGHIGFNEPGSNLNSVTRKVELSENTRRVNSRFFGLFGKVPKCAYTIGIKNIMNSKRIVLLAFGRSKSKAVSMALEGKISKDVPASFLRKHRDITFIVDEKAASKLKSKIYL